MDILHQLRYCFRKLRKSPGSSLLAVVAMGLGISLTTVMVSIADGFLAASLPFDPDERLLHLERNRLERGVTSMGVPLRDFEDWRGQQTSFEGLAGFTEGKVNVSDSELPERYDGAWISANFLDLVRVAPALGRGFQPGDEAPGAAPVVLIGHSVWQERYGGDPEIVGRGVHVDSAPATIVGVLPQGFRSH